MNIYTKISIIYIMTNKLDIICKNSHNMFKAGVEVPVRMKD